MRGTEYYPGGIAKQVSLNPALTVIDNNLCVISGGVAIVGFRAQATTRINNSEQLFSLPSGYLFSIGISFGYAVTTERYMGGTQRLVFGYANGGANTLYTGPVEENEWVHFFLALPVKRA